jgi:hypothetical protein
MYFFFNIQEHCTHDKWITPSIHSTFIKMRLMIVKCVMNGDSGHVRKHSERSYLNYYLIKVTQLNRNVKQWLFRQNVTSEQGTPFVTLDGAVVP